MKRVVKTQAEFDAAIADGADWVEVRSERGVWIEVTAYDSATVTASEVFKSSGTKVS